MRLSLMLLLPLGAIGADAPRPNPPTPKGYVCHRAIGPMVVDGLLDEESWARVPWTESFVDIEGDARPRPRYATRVKMLWNDESFLIAAEMEEPHVWGTLTQHDAVIFQDNDFEVFLDPDGDNHEYAELEVNPLNTTWDLLLRKPYRDGGPAENSYEILGLRTAVAVNGTLNRPVDQDRGWTLEVAIPWKSLATIAHRPSPPEEGDQWRINFSRVEWRHEVAAGRYRKVPNAKEDNWVWSPQGVVDMHRPERWGYVQFTRGEVGKVRLQRDPTGPARDRLMAIYHAQRAFHATQKRWAATLEELGIDPARRPPTVLKLTPSGFEAMAVAPIGISQIQSITIGPDSRLTIGPRQTAPGIDER